MLITDVKIHLKMLMTGVISIFLLGTDAFASGQEAGTVISLTPGVFAERDGKRIPLTHKSVILSGDLLTTDATGRVRIWMRDETTLSLGSDTEFEIEEYDDTAAKPRFTAKMTGLARMLTGKIVKANPEGFKVTTPQAVVGIRGTILTVHARRSGTTVYVENSLRRVVVNGVTVPSGDKALVPQAGAVPQLSPITPEDRRALGTELAARMFPGSSASAGQNMRAASLPAAPAAPDGDGARMTAEAKVGGRDGMVGHAVATSMDVMPQSVTPPINPSIDPVMPQWPATLPETVYVLGSLQDSRLFGSNMSISEFNFTANLKTGAVSNASMQGGIMDGNQYNLSGGSGTINPSSFNIHSLTGTYDHYVPTSQDGWARDQVTGTMSGSVTAGASTLNVTGNYSVKDATGATLDSGTVSGSSLAH